MRILRLIVGLLLGILVSAILYIKFYSNIKSEISIGEIVTSTVGALITVSVFYAGNQVNKKKDIKDLLVQELGIIELSLKDMENIIVNEFKNQDIGVQKSQIILQGKIRYIANKIEYISKQLDNKELLYARNKFRDEVTEKFGGETFKFDEDYLILFTKNYTNILTKMIGTKKEIIDG